MRTSSNDNSLPMSNLSGATVLDAKGIASVNAEEFERRLELVDRFLPTWGMQGIRNRVVQEGYCVGFVDPTSPINPMSKTQRDEYAAELAKSEEVPTKVEVLGSLLRLKAVIIRPVVTKAEIEAYAYRLLTKPSLAYDGVDSGDSKDSSVVVWTTASRVARERLVNKAPVTISFCDVVIDYASEKVLTDAKSVDIGPVLGLVDEVVSGKYKQDYLDLNSKEKAPETANNDKEKFELAMLYKKGTVYSHSDSLNKDILGKVMNTLKYSKVDFLTDLGLEEDLSPSDTGVFFQKSLRGLILLFGLNAQWEAYADKVARTLPSIKDTETKDRVGDALKALALVGEEVDRGDIVPEVLKVKVKESRGNTFTVPLQGSDSYASIQEGAKKILFDILLGYDEGGTRKSLVTKVVLDLNIHEFDVRVEASSTGVKLVKSSPGSKSAGLIPLKLSLEYVDVIDRVQNTLAIFDTSSQELKKVVKLGYLFDFLVAELYASKEG